MLLWKRGSVFIFAGNERLCIHSGLRNIRFNLGRPAEYSPIGADSQDDSMSKFPPSSTCRKA